MSNSKDPLSLLAGDSSSSESEVDEEKTQERKKSLTDKSYYTPSELTNTSEKLPSPDTLFSSVTRPDFLSSHLSSHKVNWDDMTKNINDTTDLSSTHTNGNYNSVPPPEDEIDPRSEISSDPVKYSITESSVDPKLLTVSSNTSDTEYVKAGLKRAQDKTSTSITKKPKSELFREKEKRKRDLGMSSRGKNFVEEEKRILREQFEKK